MTRLDDLLAEQARHKAALHAKAQAAGLLAVRIPGSGMPYCYARPEDVTGDGMFTRALVISGHSILHGAEILGDVTFPSLQPCRVCARAVSS